MPGIFGVTGASEDVAARFIGTVRERLPAVSVEVAGNSAQLAGHAVNPFRAIGRDADVVWAVDGERSLYVDAAKQGAWSRPTGSAMETHSAGNVAVLADGGRSLLVRADHTGTFPLYYASADGALLFGSLLRPLASALAAAPDDVAVLQFLRQAYIVGSRTMFSGIRRLLPGQELVFADGQLLVRECNRTWCTELAIDGRAAARETWERLRSATQRALPEERSTLMMSGGWDSRTLLAAAKAGHRHLACYSHGDVESRELQLVDRICRDQGLDCRFEPIDERVLDIPSLQDAFTHTENVVFPHWHRAGRVLEHESDCVVAGVYGEIIGGHYGPAMLASSAAAKAALVGLPLLTGRSLVASNGRTAADYLVLHSFPHHWYLDTAFEESLDRPLEQLNADTASELHRLRQRGVRSELALVEAFISENRGAQYINAQLRSLRAQLHVALPFGGGELFTFSTAVPFQAKVHNSLNRRMLAASAPQLLKYPMAATLLPARSPIIAQEFSRAARKLRDHVRARTRGTTPRDGWVNFSFLRSGTALQNLVDDLRCDLWDRPAIHRTIEQVRGQSISMHPMYDQLSKVYTVDLMLRQEIQC